MLVSFRIIRFITHTAQKHKHMRYVWDKDSGRHCKLGVKTQLYRTLLNGCWVKAELSRTQMNVNIPDMHGRISSLYQFVTKGYATTTVTFEIVMKEIKVPHVLLRKAIFKVIMELWCVKCQTSERQFKPIDVISQPKILRVLPRTSLSDCTVNQGCWKCTYGMKRLSHGFEYWYIALQNNTCSVFAACVMSTKVCVQAPDTVCELLCNVRNTQWHMPGIMILLVPHESCFKKYQLINDENIVMIVHLTSTVFFGAGK